MQNLMGTFWALSCKATKNTFDQAQYNSIYKY